MFAKTMSKPPPPEWSKTWMLEVVSPAKVNACRTAASKAARVTSSGIAFVSMNWYLTVK